MCLNRVGKTGRFFCFFFIFIMLFNTAGVRAEDSRYSRIFGNDRYETAVEICKNGWNTSRYAVIARGDDFPDALCAGPLAKKYGAPILLTETESLNPTVLAELKRLGVVNVMIAGGFGAVSKNVEDELISQGMIVQRFAGEDRYETSVKIAKELGSPGKMVLATGNDFPDALSVSAIASSLGMPILLTGRGSLPPSVGEYISSRNIEKTYVIGGQGVISDRVLELVPGGERVAGCDRFETNVAVMEKFLGELNFNHIYAAVADGPSGKEFADALSGSVLAANAKSPVVLVYKTLPKVTGNFIKPRMNTNSRVTALGGEAVVSQAVVNDMLNINESAVYIKVISPPAGIKAGEKIQVAVDVSPYGAAIKAVSSNPGVVGVSVSANTITLTGMSQGTAVITVTASMAGYSDGIASFVISPPVYNLTKDMYFETIQRAIDYSSPGDTIKIGAGTYYEHIIVKKNNLKFIGAGRDSTIIDATQTGGITRSGIKIKDVSGIEIKNLTVRNAGINMTNENGREPYGIYLKNTDKNLFDNLRLQGNGEYEFYLFDGCDLNTIQNSIIDGKGSGDKKSLDGIFCSGGESGKSSMSTGNKFIKNTITNVVAGIALTACEGTEVVDNTISPSDSASWPGFVSAGVILGNSSANTVRGNNINTGKYGVRLSSLSSMSPYAYAGAPNVNTVKGNTIVSTEYGVKVMGTGNMVKDNNISGNLNGGGVWLSDSAKNTDVSGNILSNNGTGILVDNGENKAWFNKITGGTLGVKNTTGTMFDAAKNWWGVDNPKSRVSANVDCSPWLGTGYDADSSTTGFQIASPMTWCTGDSLSEVLSLAAPGDIIKLSKGTYVLDSQLIVYKNLTITGSGRGDTVLKIGFDTSETGDSRAAVLVSTGRTLNLSNLTIEGVDRKVAEAVRTLGSGTVENVEIRNIGYDGYNGYGIYACGSSDMVVKNSVFTGIAKAGIGVYDNAMVTIGGSGDGEGNTFTGDGEGSFIQHAVIVNKGTGNAQAVIMNNTINGYSGTAVDGEWSSSGISVKSGTVTVTGNTFEGCPQCIKVWSGSVVNGTTVDASSAETVGKALEDANTSTGEGVVEAVIYDGDGKVLVPKVVVPGT